MSVSLLEFISAFFPDANEPICLRAFAPKGAPGRPEYQPTKVIVTPAILANHKAGLLRLNKTRGLYFVVNVGGDTDATIKRFNAAFCENDELSIEEQHRLLDKAPLPTSSRIETVKSIHAYWLLKRGCTEAEWRELQARLLVHFGGDPKIKNPSRVMRLPYFNHVSLNGDGNLHFKRVELVEFEPARRYSVEELLQAFPVSEAVGTTAEAWPNTGKYETWDELNAELRRRIASHSTAKKRLDGWIHCKGLCHGGKSDSAIALNPATGKYHCTAGCDTVH